MPTIPPPTEPEESRKHITVYLTGFGSFGKYTKNPSWEIVSSFLPSASVSTDLYSISIVPHPEFVKVAYETVDTLIPQVHAEKEFDYILHVGVGLPGDYEIEAVAHEKGYVKGDVDGLIPGGAKANPRVKDNSGDTGKDGVAETDGGRVYKTDLDIERIIGMVDACAIIPRKTPDTPIAIRKSTDAGRYMCEYIYLTSLRCATDPARRVLFVHVPPKDEPYSIETGKRFLEKFIIAYVTEGERLRRQRNGEL